MTKINNIQSMEFNFFESPNKLYAFSSDMILVIIAELEDFNFENNFCIDSITFEMLKKLKTDRSITFEKNAIIIKSKEGKFKSQLILKQKPALKNDIFDYQGVYPLAVLNKASRFVSKNKVRPFLTGVLFDEHNGVIGTDTFRIYAYSIKGALKYSVPTNFISLLREENCLLKFNKNKVMYQGDYQIVSSLYSGELPDLTKVLEKVRLGNDHKIEIKKCDEMSFHMSTLIEFHLQNNNLELNYKNDVNEFKVNIPVVSDIEANYIFNYEQFMSIFDAFENIDLNYSQNSLSPIYIKSNEEAIVLMPMRSNK